MNGRKTGVSAAVGCAACHVPKLGNVDGVYSDLLLHDMGPELGDVGQYGVFDPNSSEADFVDPEQPAGAPAPQPVPVEAVSEPALVPTVPEATLELPPAAACHRAQVPRAQRRLDFRSRAVRHCENVSSTCNRARPE